MSDSMLTHRSSVVVGYADTDQMGVVHHSNYARYCEVARTNALKHLGASYRQMEANGVMMPVTEMHFKFFRPALYDDTIIITTSTSPRVGARVVFAYQLHNQHGELLCEASTTLGFLCRESKRPCRPPAWFVELMAGGQQESPALG